MRTWYQVVAKYTKEVDGKLRKVSEKYLVDALSYTEAEARAHRELGMIIRGEFSIPKIDPQNIVEVFHYEDVEDWFKATVSYVTYDEETGREKKTSHIMLVTAHDLREAYDRLKESLKDLMVDFTIPKIEASPILDVFPYISKEEAESVDVEESVLEAVRSSFEEYDNGDDVHRALMPHFTQDDLLKAMPKVYYEQLAKTEATTLEIVED